jgi:hypothetical protein
MRPLKGAHALSAAAVLSFGCVSTAAYASIPPVELRWTVDGDVLYDDAPSGVDNGNGTYTYEGQLPGGGLELDYSVQVGPVARMGVGITTFTNATMDPIDVVLEAFLPIAPITGDTTMTGSAAFGLTTPSGGGSLTSLDDGPAWQAFVDEASVMGLLDPLEMINPGIGSLPVVFENRGPVSGPPGAQESIGIKIAFSLAPGSVMSMTSVFDVVPAPSGLALLAAGALVTRRRRRGT